MSHPHPPPSPNLLIAPSLLLGSMLSLTIGATIAKGLFQTLGPAGATFMRLSIAALMLLALWRPWRAIASRSITRPQLRTIALYGIVLGLMNLTFFEAIARLPIGIAIALEFLGPLSIAFFLSRSKLDILWATLALIGVALLLPLTHIQAHLDPIGILFALVAAALWATYILIGKKASNSAHPGIATAIGMFIAALAVAPFGTPATLQVSWDSQLLFGVLAMGLLSSAIPYSLEMAALKRLDSKTFGILLSLEPALGALTAYLFLHEHITLIQCLAITGVMAASIGSTITAQRKPEPTTT